MWGTSAGNSGQLMSISGTISEYERHQTFTYDNVGRLATATGWADITWSRRFTYDRWGNRTKTEEQSSKSWCTKQVMDFKVGPGGEPLTNQATSVENYTDCSFDKASPGLYDAAGNTKSYGTRNGWISHIYDGESRLARFQQQDGESLWQYSYDAANRRVKKVAEGAPTHYVWEGGQVISEHNGVTGAAISEYVFAGSRMVARDDSATLRYYHQDRLSTRMSTAGNGVIVGTQDHMPFGEDATSTNSKEQEKHRFTSYERDSESNTDYAVNRQYGTATGRFLQPDPIQGSFADPQSLNRYAYVTNEPVGFVDPLGLDKCVIVVDCKSVEVSCDDPRIPSSDDPLKISVTEWLSNPYLPDWSKSSNYLFLEGWGILLSTPGSPFREVRLPFRQQSPLKNPCPTIVPTPDPLAYLQSLPGGSGSQGGKAPSRFDYTNATVGIGRFTAGFMMSDTSGKSYPTVGAGVSWPPVSMSVTRGVGEPRPGIYIAGYSPVLSLSVGYPGGVGAEVGVGTSYGIGVNIISAPLLGSTESDRRRQREGKIGTPVGRCPY